MEQTKVGVNRHAMNDNGPTVFQKLSTFFNKELKLSAFTEARNQNLQRIEGWKQLLRSYPKDGEAHHELAKCFLKAKLPADAIESLLKALYTEYAKIRECKREINFDLACAYKQKGDEEQRGGVLEEAKKSYEESVRRLSKGTKDVREYDLLRNELKEALKKFGYSADDFRSLEEFGLAKLKTMNGNGKSG